MYNVSQAYLAAIHGNVNRAYVTFTIDNVTYTEQNLLSGSFNISNQCTGTNDVVLGAVYVGVLNAVLRNVNINRQLWRGKVITPTFHFLVDEETDTWETVPLGVFTISKANWTKAGVSIRADDNMSKFDKPFSMSQSSGTLYDFLSLASTACGVQLAQTREEFALLPNGSATFLFYSNSGVETWRDFVSYIAQVCGGFATIDRAGKLAIRTYSQTAVDTIDTHERHTNAVFSDYITKYTAVSVTFIDTKEIKVYAQEVNDGLMMTLGANPFLQNESQANNAVPNILTAMESIQFCPHKTSVASNPVYDLGDAIEFVDGLAGTSSLCCVHKYEFYLHKQLKLSGFGSDPNSAEAKSKTAKQLSQIASSVSNSSMGAYELRNASAYTIASGGRRRVLNLKMLSTVASRIQIHMNICLVSAADEGYDFTRVVATYTVNSDDDETIHPEETYVDGKHVLHLMYILPVMQDSATYFRLTLDAFDGSIAIGEGGIWAYAEGAGIVGDGKWSGSFDIFEDADMFDVGTEITVSVATENFTIAVAVPQGGTFSDTATLLDIMNVPLDQAMTDRVRIVNYEDECPRVTEDEEDVRVTEDGDLRYTEKEHS